MHEYNYYTSTWFLFDRTRVEPYYLFPPWTRNYTDVFRSQPAAGCSIPGWFLRYFAPFQNGFLLKTTGWTFTTFPCASSLWACPVAAFWCEGTSLRVLEPQPRLSHCLRPYMQWRKLLCSTRQRKITSSV